MDAIVTCDLINADLSKLLKSGKVKLLTDMDDGALKIHSPFFRSRAAPSMKTPP